jgi:hypothetical protein
MENTKMQIIDSGKIFVGKPNSEFAKSCFPYVVQLSNGDLFASFQAASVKNGIDSKAMLARSIDGGKTWAEPVAPFNSILNGRQGSLHLAYVSELKLCTLVASILWCDHFNDKALEFFNPTTGGLLPTEACVSFSKDNGRTWSSLQSIPKGTLEGMPTPIMGPVHRLDNGMLICPFETSKSYNDAGTWHHKAAYFISYDNGRTWPEHKVVAHDPQSRIYFWDHRIANLGKGRLVDLFWAYDAVENRELNAYISKTVDCGQAWSQPLPTSIVGQPWPIPVSNDQFAVVVVDRNYSQTIKLYLTNNHGESFDAAEPLIIYNAKKPAIHESTLNEQLTQMGNWFYGLPSGCKLMDGKLLIVYYAGNDTSTDINWCKVKI